MLTVPFAPKRSWFLAASVIAFALIAAFSIYFKFQHSSLEKQLQELTAQKEALENPAETTAADSAALKASAAKVRTELQEIEASGFSWSKIIEKIENTVPKLQNTSTGIVDFRSYNGSEDGKISVSALTRPNAFDAFSDVALTIEAFAAEPSFKNVFVPSITKSITPQGETVLGFGLNLEYEKMEF